jgi:hypothetical protein
MISSFLRRREESLNADAKVESIVGFSFELADNGDSKALERMPRENFNLTLAANHIKLIRN